MAARIRKNDMVIVISGGQKGGIGKVIEVCPRSKAVKIEGINMKKKKARPTAENPSPERVAVEFFIDASNVSLLDPKANVPTRVGFKVVDGQKVRYAKKSGELIEVTG